ncbi:MAG: ROK family transcriptional regulator, partial [Clostridia bacterium]
MKNQVGSLEMIKHINQSLVLSTIRKEEPISRAQISKKLKLSRSTVGQIVDFLIENEMIFEKGIEASASKVGGRPGQMLWFNPVSSYLVGIDLNDESTRLCIADLTGKPQFTKAYAPARDADEMAKTINSALEEAHIKANEISRLTISVPGTVNTEGVVLKASRLHWRNYDLKGLLSKQNAFPIDVHNDVNLALVGERLF